MTEAAAEEDDRVGEDSPRPARPDSRTTRRARWLAIAGLLFLLAFLPRAAALSKFITWDELFWTRAALKFNRELEGQDWRDTYVIGQPGVVTMWLGTAALLLRAQLGPAGLWDEQLEAGSLRYRDDDQTTLRVFAGHWRGLPLVTALVTALAVVGAWALARRDWGEPAALAAGVLLALDPFFLAHSRVFALDGVLASLCLMSLLCLQRYSTIVRRPDLVAGAILAGLAVVQKVPAMAVVAWGAMVVPLAALKRSGGRSAGLALASWLGLVAITAVVAWPALWTAPWETLGKVGSTLATYDSSAYDSMYFAGQAGVAPGPLFYPVVWLFRASPLVLFGLLLLAWRAGRRDPAVPLAVVAVLGGFSLLFAGLLTVASTKFDRYLLPAELPLVMLAGLGWAAAARRTWQPRRLGGSWPALGLAVAAGALLIGVAPAYYLAWYNPLAGGSAVAEGLLPRGWGEGTEQVVDYLNAQPEPDRLVVAAEGLASLAPLRGQVVRAVGDACRTADLVVVTAFDRQLGNDVARTYADQSPTFVALVNGRGEVWVYPGGRPCSESP